MEGEGDEEKDRAETRVLESTMVDVLVVAMTISFMVHLGRESISHIDMANMLIKHVPCTSSLTPCTTDPVLLPLWLCLKVDLSPILNQVLVNVNEHICITF